MKIGIESQRIFRKARHGMDVVALELIRQLQRLDNANEYVLFARDGEDRTCIRETENFKIEIIGGATYADWEQVSLPLAVKRVKPAILHSTANTAPLICAVPLVLTIHDIIYLEETNFKGSAYQNFGNLYRKFIVPHAIKKAGTIITVSENEKKLIIEKCDVDPDKIVVIHNGVANKFHGGYAGEEKNKFATRYNLPPQFILHLGNTAPKKNTKAVVGAYVHYCDNVKNPMHIVISDYSADIIKSILRKSRREELIPNFHLPGYIPYEQMPLLYNCSSLFLYPSLRESFGMPILEAMACGIPVISSNIPAIREVAEDAAVLVNPESGISIAEALLLLSSDQSLQNSCTQKGLARASRFSWENAAKKLLQVYTTSMASP